MGRFLVVNDDFPFGTLKIMAVVLGIVASALCGIGIGDVTHSALRYRNNTECRTTHRVVPEYWKSPCGNEALTYCYVAAPVWGGILVLMLAIYGVTFDRYQDPYSCDTRRRNFLYAALFIGLLIFPLTCALAVVELVKGYDVFYNVAQTEGGLDDMADPAKFGLPVAVIALSALGMVAALFAAFLTYSNSIIEEDRDSDPREMYGSYDNAVSTAPYMTMPYAGMKPYASPYVMNPALLSADLGGKQAGVYATYGGLPANTYGRLPANGSVPAITAPGPAYYATNSNPYI